MKMKTMALMLCSALIAHGAEEMVRVGGSGRLAIVDACGGLQQDSISGAAGDIRRILMLDVSTPSGGEWSLADSTRAFAAADANAAVFVVKDSSLPISLVALESKWGVVNATGLSDGAVKKEILRVATMVLGGAGSHYPASSMRPAFTAEEIDTKTGDAITFDSMMAIFNYIPALGMKQYRMMDREDAVEAGYIKANSSGGAK